MARDLKITRFTQAKATRTGILSHGTTCAGGYAAWSSRVRRAPLLTSVKTSAVARPCDLGRSPVC